MKFKNTTILYTKMILLKNIPKYKIKIFILKIKGNILITKRIKIVKN